MVVGAAGSGKTILVKRIVEQCALRGVSAIVLDPNDDLGRLGDPWPSPPKGWTDEQEQQAQRYFSETEVVVWTPGLNRGRPLSFRPLPDFGPVLGDQDDFGRDVRSNDQLATCLSCSPDPLASHRAAHAILDAEADSRVANLIAAGLNPMGSRAWDRWADLLPFSTATVVHLFTIGSDLIQASHSPTRPQNALGPAIGNWPTWRHGR